MKKCTNQDCPSNQGNRGFYDSDTICPQCGEVLAAAGPGHPAGITRPVAYAATAISREVNHPLAMVGAVGTLLLVFLIVALLTNVGMISRGSPRNLGQVVLPGGTAIVRLPAEATATARAIAILTAQPTPIGGGLIPATRPPIFGTTATPGLAPLPPIPNATQIGGSGNNNPGNTGNTGLNTFFTPIAADRVETALCRQLEVGRDCEPTSSFKPNDRVNLAIHANFGPAATRVVRVRLFGPPSGATALTDQDQLLYPTRQGDYWVSFGFKQTNGWQPGSYQAHVFINEEATARTTTSWTVEP